MTSVTSSSLPIGVCPSYQDDAICGIVAATNIQSRPDKAMWSCTVDGLPSTDPCSSPVWSGVYCSYDGSIVQLQSFEFGLTGMAYFFA